MTIVRSPTKKLGDSSPRFRSRFVLWLSLIALVALLSAFQKPLVADVKVQRQLNQEQQVLLSAGNNPASDADDHPNPAQICTMNPYLTSLKDPVEVASKALTSWLDGSSWPHTYQDNLREATFNKTLSTLSRDRWKFFNEALVPCNSQDLTCVGHQRCGHDEAKAACGLSKLPNDCIIYSIGGNNMWMFEEDALKKTPCEIHTFDCTGNVTRFVKPDNDRLHFHHICLGTEHEPAPEICTKAGKCGETWTLLEIQKHFNHKRIDLYKMDIEGFEWGILNSWPELTNSPLAENILLPNQLLIEFHYRVSRTKQKRKGESRTNVPTAH